VRVGRGIDRQPFWMGSSDEDTEADSDERPQHQVIVSPFHLQATTTTRAQYRLYDPRHELVLASSWVGESDVFAKYAPEDSCPMINVTWYDAWVFARWLGGRLPTEAEWEYACRAGTQSRFSFGDDEDALGQYAWYDANSDDRTHPVGQKMPNGWGLHDMLGNVWEWCQDWFDAEYYANSPPEDPTGVDEASDRVNRGGCWFDTAVICRSAYRFWDAPASRFDFLGFRVARVRSGSVKSSPGQAKSRAEPGA
jgi:formylglycine-generating enzyme required for sulfatase activity